MAMTLFRLSLLFMISNFLLQVTIQSSGAAEKLTAEQTQFFEAKIRPVLVKHCYSCHSESAKEVQAGLLLDTRAGTLRGGDSGPALIPGKPEQSLLLTAIRYKNKDLQMPPADSGGILPEQVIKDFEQWIKLGASDPREGEAKIVNKYDTAAALSWWSFQPLQKVPLPALTKQPWQQTVIDALIATQHEAASLRPVPEAAAEVLIRRVTYDLTGLPPAPQEVLDFIKAWQSEATRSQVWQNTVERLLASPQFGEHWGRHWLDVARYSESSGKDVNVVFPTAYRYRDYVVAALNSDKPYNRFVLEQIAGDLLPAKNDQERANQLIATGFLAVGPKSLNETNPPQFAVDLADEQIDAVTQGFLGLTVACARCHDHRFDPISQQDYTALAGIFLSTQTLYGTPGGVQGRNQTALMELPPTGASPSLMTPITAAEVQQKRERLTKLQTQAQDARAQRARGKTPTDGLTNFDVVRIITQAKQLETELSMVRDNGTPRSFAMATVDRTTTAPPAPRGVRLPSSRSTSAGFEVLDDSPLFARGDISTPRDKIPRGVPLLLARGNQAKTTFTAGKVNYFEKIPATQSGRLQLAQALVNPENPLTSRVYVNRIWSWLFGRGLVASVDNFGTTGDQPSNPALLDYLARRFVEQGWSTKEMIREIVLSRTYRLASTYDKQNYESDPDNAFLWRHSTRRLAAEEIYDSLLVSSSQLDRQPLAGSIVARAGDGPIGGERRMALSDEQISKAAHRHRALYLPVTRNVQPEVLTTFDFPDGSMVKGVREVTNVPSQALFLLNHRIVHEQAGSLAKLLLQTYPGEAKTKERLQRAYLHVLQREPNAAEQRAAAMYLKNSFPTDEAAWSSLIRALYATSDFRLVE